MSDIVFDSAFGERGTGNGQFQYPGGLVCVDNYIFVCDTQNHRVLQLSNVGLQIREIGVGELNFPHSIVYNDNKLYVTDSANHRIAVFSTYGVLLNIFGSQGSGVGEFNYPSGIVAYGDYLYVVDSQNDRVQKILKSNGAFIDEIATDLAYPFGISTQNNKLYLTQPHEVRVYDIEELPAVDYTQSMTDLTNQLFPTGRAFWRPKGSTFQNLLEGIVESESRVQNSIMSLEYDFYADSTLMSNEAVEKWTSTFGIVCNGTQVERIESVRQRQAYPSNILARQSDYFIQNELRNAGFDVYVYKGYADEQAAILGGFLLGECVLGKGTGVYSIIANNIDESLDAGFVLLGDGKKAVFTVSGQGFGVATTVPLVRKNEFRDLILKLKPAQTVGLLYINYV